MKKNQRRGTMILEPMAKRVKERAGKKFCEEHGPYEEHCKPCVNARNRARYRAKQDPFA